MKTVNFFLLILMITGLFSCSNEAETIEEVDMRAEISRVWSCSEKDDQGVRNYEVTIVKDTGRDSIVYLKNFHNTGLNNKIEGIVSSDRVIVVKDTDLPGSSYILKSCIGQISSDFQRITWDYKIDDPQTDVYTVKATYTPGTVTKSVQ